MAVIRETFVLEDRFSAVFASYLDLGRQIAATKARRRGME